MRTTDYRAEIEARRAVELLRQRPGVGRRFWKGFAVALGLTAFAALLLMAVR